MCDTRRYGLLDGNALVGRSRYEQNEVVARTRISLAATKTRLQRARKSLLRALTQHEVLH
jgi:hypothetical protein